MSIGAVMMMAEARKRQRDERGRYMEGGRGNEMYSPNSGQGGSSNENDSMYSGNGGGSNRGGNRGGNGGSSMNGNGGGSMMANYGDGHGATMNGYSHHPGWLPPYYEGGEMRRQGGGGNNGRRSGRRGEGRRNTDEGDQRRMGGYGGFVWDTMNPSWPRAGGDDDDDDEDDDSRARMMHGGNVTDMQQYRREHSEESPRKIGFGETSGKQHLTRKEAEEWVAMMDIPGDKPGETKRGGKWTFDEIKRYAGNFGITGEQQIIDFYVAVNMMYSDYCKVAKEYGLDKSVDFFAKLAKSFLHDTDAVKDKLAAYWENIAKKE